MNNETLYYVRPWNVEYFKSLSDFLNLGDSVFFSDHSNCGNYKIYNLLKKNYKNNPTYFSFLKDDDIKEIILRDRMLREISKKKALVLISTFIITIEELFQNNNLKRVISIDIDFYVSDIISRFCNKYKIPYYGYSVSLLENYLFVTNKGKGIFTRKSNKFDLNNFINHFEKKDLPSYMVQYENKLKLISRNYFRNFLKLFYYGVKLIFSKNNLLHYHYFSSYIYAKKHFFNISWIYLFKIQKPLNKISQSKKKIYVPLQFFPEHNCEYWTKKTDFISYEISLIKALKLIPKTINILIKEHPSMVGKRDVNLYLTLNKMSNVSFINSKESQKKLINFSDLCLTHNGSILIESVYYNKKTILLGNSPYFNNKFHHDILSLNHFSKFFKKHNIFNNNFKVADKNLFFKKYLSNLIYGNTSELTKDINNVNTNLMWNNLKKHIK